MTIIKDKMTPKRRFTLVYARQVKKHLQVIERRYYPLIRATVEQELAFEADVETRNRKPLKRPVDFAAEWELRFGPGNCLRVFYTIDQECGEVCILAIGVKEGNRLRIGDEEVEL